MAVTFVYSARSPSGEIQSGEMTVENREEVMAQLRRQRLIPMKVEEKQGFKMPTFGSGMPTRDVVIFTRQFATMINSGLPLVQSLDILAKQSDNPILGKT